jgi:hypothetical protein
LLKVKETPIKQPLKKQKDETVQKIVSGVAVRLPAVYDSLQG